MGHADEVRQRHGEIVADPYVIEQVERIYPSYVALVGVNDAPTKEELLQAVATSITALEIYPEIVTSNGPIVVAREGHGYSLLLRGPRIIAMKMTPYKAANDKFVPLKPGPWVVGEKL